MTRGRQIFHSSGGRTTSRQGSYTPPTKIPNDDLDDLIASDDTTQVPHTVDSHATQVLSPIDTQPSTRIPPSPQYHANTSTSCSDDASTSTAGTAGSVSGRPMISVRGKPFDLYPSQICSKVVGKIFKSKVDTKGYNRKHVPIYREEFKRRMEERQHKCEEFTRKFEEQLAMQNRKIAEMKAAYESKMTQMMIQIASLISKFKRRKGSKKSKGSMKAFTESDMSSDDDAGEE